MRTLKNKLVLVLGLGESGLAMAQWCAGQGARVRVADTRSAPPGLSALRHSQAAIECVCGEAFSSRLLEGVDLMALSPGVDLRDPVFEQARARGIERVGEMALFADALKVRRASSRLLAITGTNGKTTTTALTAHILNRCGVDAVAAGNISPSALSVLMQREAEGRALPQCWVLELSSFQLELTEQLQLDAATVLNVSDDHLDRHGSIDAYARIKARIYEAATVQVLNRDDARVSAMARAGRAQVRIGTDLPATARDFGLCRQDGRLWLVQGAQSLLPLDVIALQGLHNALNVQAALALAGTVADACDCLCEAVKSFEAMPHRMSPVCRRADGVTYYDDSKGTNVGATVAALQGVSQPVVLIAGGDGKGQDFTPLREAVRLRARAVVLFGRDASRIEQALCGLGVAVERAEDLEAAVKRADVLARAGDVVLFSPACASFDMFRNYVQRGQAYCAAVKRLVGEVLS